MKGLNHQFVLLPVTSNLKEQYPRHINDPRSIYLHEDVVSYIYDSLKWVPTENPANPATAANAPNWGLNYFGATAIRGQGAVMLASILRSWVAVFANAPPVFEITGNWGMIEGEPESGGYEKIRVDRAELIATLRAIAALADEASKDGFWLMHFGL